MNFKMNPKGVEWLDELAAAHHTDRSSVLRTALTVARRHEADIIKILETS